MVGRVVSNKMQNTVAVLVVRKKVHPLYKKQFTTTKKYLVDDPLAAKEGDIVIFEKIKPISKRKHWQIKKILGKDVVSLEQAELKQEAASEIAVVMTEKESKKEPVIVEDEDQTNKVQKKKGGRVKRSDNKTVVKK